MYATVSQADSYIQSYYSSTDSLRAAWTALSDKDKQVLLNRAEQVIDQLPFKGLAIVTGKAFPRDPNQDYSLAQAQLATIELALQQQDVEAQERYKLQHQGVVHYKIGDLEENFAVNSSKGVNSRAFSIVFPFLKDWLGGGYKICPARTRK